MSLSVTVHQVLFFALIVCNNGIALEMIDLLTFFLLLLRLTNYSALNVLVGTLLPFDRARLTLC